MKIPFSPQLFICARNSFTSVFWYSSPGVDVLRGTIASISSKQMMQGASRWASSNNSATFFWVSWIIIPPISEGTINLKEKPVSSANFCAKNVFPQPAGPYRSIPLGGVILYFAAFALFFRGQITSSESLCLSSSNPATSANPPLTFAIGWKKGKSCDSPSSAKKGKSSLVSGPLTISMNLILFSSLYLSWLGIRSQFVLLT